jgi:hypothetical protein
MLHKGFSVKGMTVDVLEIGTQMSESGSNIAQAGLISPRTGDGLDYRFSISGSTKSFEK